MSLFDLIVWSGSWFWHCEVFIFCICLSCGVFLGNQADLRHKTLFLWCRTFSNNQLFCNFYTPLASGTGRYEHFFLALVLVTIHFGALFFLFIHNTLNPTPTRTFLIGIGGFNRLAETFDWFVLVSSIIFFRLTVVMVFIKTIPFRCDAKMNLTFFAK